jgi:hypothetical protein
LLSKRELNVKKPSAPLCLPDAWFLKLNSTSTSQTKPRRKPLRKEWSPLSPPNSISLPSLRLRPPSGRTTLKRTFRRLKNS